MSHSDPVIVAYFDGEPEFRVLSNFAQSPFELDGIEYESVEAFWQSLKTEIPAFREEISKMYGINAKRAGRMVQRQGVTVFTYADKMYTIGSEAHHILMERALRAKFNQHTESQNALIATGERPLKHMLKNKFGQFIPGDSPALPAIAFENMLARIRSDIRHGFNLETLNLPKGLNEF